MNFDSNEEIIKTIVQIIEGHDFTVHEYGDPADEYSYLNENDICITVKSSSGEDVIYIDIADELTLTLGAWHEHFDYSDEDFSEMLETIKDYLAGRTCVLELYRQTAGELKWFGSYILIAEQCNSTPAKKLVKRYANKDWWPIKGKAIFRFFDADKTTTHEFSFGNA